MCYRVGELIRERKKEIKHSGNTRLGEKSELWEKLDEGDSFHKVIVMLCRGSCPEFPHLGSGWQELFLPRVRRKYPETRTRTLF